MKDKGEQANRSLTQSSNEPKNNITDKTSNNSWLTKISTQLLHTNSRTSTASCKANYFWTWWCLREGFQKEIVNNICVSPKCSDSKRPTVSFSNKFRQYWYGKNIMKNSTKNAGNCEKKYRGESRDQNRFSEICVWPWKGKNGCNQDILATLIWLINQWID